MNCEQVQPNLLDYSRKLLNGPERELIAAHLNECAACRQVLREEMLFCRRLAAVQDEVPANDVWAFVRSRTRPKRVRPLVWLHSLVATNARRIATASVALAVAGVAFYNVAIVTPEPPVVKSHPVVAVYSDDPLGGHTDAVIDSIDDM